MAHAGGRVFRILTARGAEGYRQAAEALAGLQKRGLLVATAVLDPLDPARAGLQAAWPDAEEILEHERIEPVTWPSEWTNAMLADAGLHTLEVQRTLLKHKLALKDATAFNVTFSGGEPRFLDVTSAHRPARLDIWYALGQFQRMFLYPLLLARRGLTPADVFLGHLDGLTPRKTAELLGRWGWLHPGRLLQVYLPAWLEGSASAAASGEAETQTGNPEVQETILNSNARALRRLRRKLSPRGVWVDYRHSHSYSSEEDKAKREFVKNFAQEHKPRVAIDIGANTGEYSRMLAPLCGRVIAVEGDHDALDVFYRERGGLKNVDFIRADIANPTPGTGFQNRERAPLLERLRGDAVFALALAHHLLVSAGLTMRQVAELLTGFAPRLVVEYVAPADPMFRKLVVGREDLWGGLDERVFLQAFTTLGWEVTARLSLKDGGRVLFAMRGASA